MHSAKVADASQLCVGGTVVVNVAPTVGFAELPLVEHAPGTARSLSSSSSSRTGTSDSLASSFGSAVGASGKIGLAGYRSARAVGTCLHALWSVSMLVLLITVTSAILPAICVWYFSADGLQNVQDSYLAESLKKRSSDISKTLKLKLEHCEMTMANYGVFMDGKGAQGTSKTDLDVALANKMQMYVAFYDGGCGTAVSTSGRNGIVKLTLQTPDDFLTIQYGFPPNVSAVNHPFDRNELLYYPNITTKSSSKTAQWSWFQKQGLMPLLPRRSVVWGPMEPFHKDFSLSVNTTWATVGMYLMYGWLTTDDTTLRGVHRTTVTTDLLKDLFASEASNSGLVCAFLMTEDGRLIATSCNESVSYNNSNIATIRYANESIIPVVRQAFANYPGAGFLSADDVFVKQDHPYSFAYQKAQTAGNFTAVAVVIGRTKFFETSYKDAQAAARVALIVGATGALFISALVLALVILGMLEVVRRLGDVQNRQIGTSSARRRGHWIRWLWESLFEVDLMLARVQWLLGVTSVVAQFLPSVSKVLFEQRKADPTQLQDAGMRRLPGTYMFVDIVKFTTLCEAQSMDEGTVKQLLEAVYTLLERTVLDSSGDAQLIKRLGDGSFFMWGPLFKMHRISKYKNANTAQAAYRAAVEIAENVAGLFEEMRRGECITNAAAIPPDWRLALRFGIATGIATQGVLKTPLVNSVDVIGTKVNLAARLEQFGKSKELASELGERPWTCLITTDEATHEQADVPAIATHEVLTLHSVQLCGFEPMTVHTTVIRSPAVAAVTPGELQHL
eukprot:TRINITY_DN12145_c0_g1_i1.p1 TRINITY_DN12145_c0_g1~~TRINITY_DN12145_c0_g1_i1.p1  ORF type:complete len:809 (+),score=210.54 TRINITY_DN12145_c0_g1_i1:62-2428(+)